jgi:GNAT superfamily N-acetyltransferase
MNAAPIVALSAERDPRAEAAVTGGLAAFNKATFGHVDAQTLDIIVRDGDDGQIVGGLLFLDLFYLPENLRGAGLGGRIIALAEDEARRRGCSAAFVYTTTFQAPGFYERHGYRSFGEIACPPADATRIFLTKALDQGADGLPASQPIG